jgi:hypothetical protein
MLFLISCLLFESIISCGFIKLPYVGPCSFIIREGWCFVTLLIVLLQAFVEVYKITCQGLLCVFFNILIFWYIFSIILSDSPFDSGCLGLDTRALIELSPKVLSHFLGCELRAGVSLNRTYLC